MSSPKFVLASQSPRRKQLLEEIGAVFVTQKPTCDENVLQSQFLQSQTITSYHDMNQLVTLLAKEKARSIQSDLPVLASDTLVVDGIRILGKPNDVKEAKEMLISLLGKTHYVLTGVALFAEESYIFHEITKVTFFPKSSQIERLVDQYVASKSPMDKAGGYGIQDRGRLFVESIQGDYYNVVGLPIAKVYHLLQRHDLID